MIGIKGVHGNYLNVNELPFWEFKGLRSKLFNCYALICYFGISGVQRKAIENFPVIIMRLQILEMEIFTNILIGTEKTVKRPN